MSIRILHLFDASRGRRLTTVLRSPAVGPTGARGGPYPLIVFGHGFAVTPAPYAPLLDAWTRAGYVVAAPVFPRGSQHAPGGPDERDLPNQPGDMNFVISALLRGGRSPSGPLAGLLDGAVAVSGQSDGGDTALAAAFDPSVHRLHIAAAVILSGAEDPFARAFRPQRGTPLLAVQGTADTINPPSATDPFFAEASAPKYLLLLERSGHLPPYTRPGPVLDSVIAASLAFLDASLKGRPAALRGELARGSVGPGTSFRTAAPR